MKIALIGRYGEGNIIPGPERVARELYLQLKSNDVDVTFIEYFFTGYSDYSFFKKMFGRKKKKDNILRLGILKIIFKLLKEQYDIIHFINTQRFQIVVFFLKQFLKANFISSFHGLYKNETKLTKVKRSFFDLWVEKLSVSKSDILIFPSMLLLNLFEKEYNFTQKYFIVPNGIEESFNRRENVLDFNEYNFVYYNSFDSGIGELLNSFPSNPDFILFVIGKENKKNKNVDVTFVDPMNKEALFDFLSDKHFVIKSSAFDSFSIFVGECMCLGIIPIITENIGIKDFIKNAENGFIYESSGHNNLAKLLTDIQAGKYDLNMISNNARKIYGELNWEKIGQQYLSIYKSVV
ncbi:MAG: glycosyltransferase family 4 protein [Candidatus Thorarchaeota archaeon]